MTIIPYVKFGGLQSDSNYHFHSFKEAIMHGYDEMLTKADKFDELVKTRFRILDTEEDFEVSYRLGDSEFDSEVSFFIG